MDDDAVTESADVDPAIVAELAALLDAAAAEAVDPHEVPERLRLTEDDKKGPLGAVAMAFQYSAGYRGKEDSAFFGSMLEMTTGHRYPPALKDVSPETAALWAAVGEHVVAPLARARLNDLCFEGRWSNGGKSGRRAVDAYLTFAGDEAEARDDLLAARGSLARAGALRRALSLARKLRDGALAEQAVTAIVAAADTSLSSERPAPGVALALIEALVDDRADMPAVDDLLSRARVVYQHNIWLEAHVIDLQQRRVRQDPQARVRLQREAVTAWIREADKNQGLIRMKHLETAVKMARDYGLTDLLEEATVRLQTVRTEDLGLKSSRLEVAIPADVMEQYFAVFTNAPSWQEALTVLVVNDPPSGNTASNRQRAEEVREVAPLRSVLPTTRLGGDGLPRFTASNDEERAEWRLAEQETFLLSLQAGHVAEVLRRIWSKWGPIPEGELVAFLGGQRHVSSSLASSLARVFIRHFCGDSEGAAYTGTPKIEALVRAIVLACGTPVYRTQRERIPGQYPGLGSLLPELRKLGMDESWFRFLQTFFAAVAGANMRNEFLHGFIDEVTEPTSALIVLALLYLAVGIQLTESGDDEGATK